MTKYLTIDQVIEIHDESIKTYGGLPGLRDKNLLLSALDAPKASLFGKEMYPSYYEKGAAYLYHLILNHPFFDGNKRTGYVSLLVFYEVNNYDLIISREALEILVLEIANGKLRKEQIAIQLGLKSNVTV